MGMLHGTRRALLGPTKKNILKFDLSQVTSVMSMAVRAGTVFAGAPIVQGKFDGTGTPDVLSLVRGNAVSGYWYDNFDPYQGTFVCWWTPETDRTAGRTEDEYLWLLGSDYYLRYEHDNQQLLARCAGQPHTDALVTVAGTTYCVVVSWDSKNTIDGTNYIRISVNNVHDYGDSLLPTADSADATMYIGSRGWVPDWPSNALIEGLTIYRRVLFDGTYGKDVNGGIDEIEDIYAAGAGVDPCTITGSWGVVFALPSDSTPAALTTGTGHAWSHPHDSEIELDAFLDELYAGGNWVDEGTPLTPTSLYDVTTVNFGSGANIDDLPDNAVAGKGPITVEGWIRTGVPSSTAFFFQKAGAGAGWYWRLGTDGSLRFYLQYAGGTVQANNALRTVADSIPHHIAATYDETGDRKIRLWVDGVLAGTSVATAGNYVSDAALNLECNLDEDIAIGWLRVSNSVRYTDTFVPNSRMNPPANDGNAHLLINMDDGAGVVATDTSGNAYNGAITMGAGQWLNTHDMATDAPGARLFHAGYVFGCDAVNEGFKQVVAGLAAGSNYVFRVPVHWGADSRGQSEIIVYDETNGAAITTFLGPLMTGVHSGGNNSATLIRAAGHFVQAQIGMTLYNITDGSSTTVTAVSGDGTTVTGVLAGGTDNDWDTNDVFRFVWSDGFANHPWTETFTCELPTIARNGVGADCVSASARCLNALDEGTLMWHQVEWL